MKDAFDSVQKNFGRCDAVVNCAGIAFAFKLYSVNKKKMAEMDKIRKTLEVRLFSFLNSLIYTCSCYYTLKDEKLPRSLI